MRKSVYDPEYWRDRAAKTRLGAEAVDDLWTDSLRKLAQEYDRLANEAEQHGPILPLNPSAQSDPNVVASVPPDISANPRFRWSFLRLRLRS